MTPHDPRRTGWGMAAILERGLFATDDPENQYYYTTYSDSFHTSPYCPHIQDSERLHVTGMRSDLNGPYMAGHNRVASASEDHCDLEECSWCQRHGDRHRPCAICSSADPDTTPVFNTTTSRVIPACTACVREHQVPDTTRTVTTPEPDGPTRNANS